MDLFCICSWPKGNQVRSMNFMFSFQNGKSTFILRFSGVDSVAEKVAAFALVSFLLLSDSFIFCWNSVRLWLCRGTQEPDPVEILRIKTRDYWVEVCVKQELCRIWRILEQGLEYSSKVFVEMWSAFSNIMCCNVLSSLSGKSTIFLGQLQADKHAFVTSAIWVWSRLGSPKHLSWQSEPVWSHIARCSSIIFSCIHYVTFLGFIFRQLLFKCHVILSRYWEKGVKWWWLTWKSDTTWSVVRVLMTPHSAFLHLPIII